MNLTFSNLSKKEEVFRSVESYLHSHHLSITARDDNRPWGGFFVIAESDAGLFIETFFADVVNENLDKSNKLSPKILIVAPHKRLSWQYHFRRAEIWKLIAGQAGVVTSDTNEENKTRLLQPGNIVELKQGERHRLIGMEGWGIVAEIWQHTDPENPSDEDDIVRLQDDFGRGSG